MEKKTDDLYEALIDKIAGGDKNALSLLYGHIKSTVYGFALSIVQNTHDAEDVLQDAFVSIYASAGHYKKMGKPMAWVLTITRNTALMKIRERRKNAEIPEEEWALFIADDAPVTTEERIVLTAAMKEISGEESQIVMLHAVGGFKHKDIAEMLDLPLSTVLSKYSRAVKKLKTILKEGDTHAKQKR